MRNRWTMYNIQYMNVALMLHVKDLRVMQIHANCLLNMRMISGALGAIMQEILRDFCDNKMTQFKCNIYLFTCRFE